MTVGEKIQKYRKELGLSQDELGQKLLVSRQTISLWEKDQTVPTIDNLMRLKEIFGVSVDDILSGEENEQKQKISANETYRFNFTQDELKTIKSRLNAPFYRKIAIFTLAFLFVIISLFSSPNSDSFIGAAIAFLLVYLFINIKIIASGNKNWKKNSPRILATTYEYLLFDDYLVVNLYRDGEKMREFKCYFSDIDQLIQFDAYLSLQFCGLAFYIKKDALKENSAFYAYIHKNPTKVKNIVPFDRWRITSIVLFVASLLSVNGALVLVNAVPGDMLQNMWMFFLLTPVPISSVVLGFILKAKGYKYKKNIIAGFIMTFFLCIYGCFTFMF